MSKNKVIKPKFLDIQSAREINNYVYQGTGCFLFLTLPENKLLSPLPESSYGSGYMYNVINLYKMYYDYGRYFLWFCIQKSVMPPCCSPDDEDMVRNRDSLINNQPRIMEHYRFITKVARHVLAHGIYQQEMKFPPYKDPKVSDLENIFKRKLAERSWPESEKDWRTINQWVTGEADFLYDWIKSWASLWKKNNESDIQDLQKKFYFGRWDYASDRDNCEVLEDEDYSLGEYEGDQYNIYDESNDKMTSFARSFPYQFVFDAQKYLASSVQGNVRSQYSPQEDYGYWKSNDPFKHVKSLFMNINYYGIDNVRQKMMNKKKGTVACPDGYKLYLEGLTTKMTTFPYINKAPKKKSRFVRR